MKPKESLMQMGGGDVMECEMKMKRKHRTQYKSAFWEGAIDQELKERASASRKNNDARNIRKAQAQNSPSSPSSANIFFLMSLKQARADAPFL